MSILSQLYPNQSQFIQSNNMPEMTSKADLINLDKLKNSKIDINPTTPMQPTISDKEKAKLKKLAERDQIKRNRRAYWHLSKEELSDARPGIVGEGLGQVGNIINALSQPDPNSQSTAALSEQIDRNAKINAEQFAQKQAAWEEQLSKAEQTLRGPQTNATWEQQNLLAQEAMKGPLKKTIPDNGQISAPNQFGKQGMKIEYMNLFK